MQVPDDGGPFTAQISGFLDSKGNPAREDDTPTWSSSDESIATVAVGAGDPLKATVTLTGTLGQAQIIAAFPGADAGGHGPAYSVTGALEVVAGAAVSATMAITGPGL